MQTLHWPLWGQSSKQTLPDARHTFSSQQNESLCCNHCLPSAVEDKALQNAQIKGKETASLSSSRRNRSSTYKKQHTSLLSSRCSRDQSRMRVGHASGIINPQSLQTLQGRLCVYHLLANTIPRGIMERVTHPGEIQISGKVDLGNAFSVLHNWNVPGLKGRLGDLTRSGMRHLSRDTRRHATLSLAVIPADEPPFKVDAPGQRVVAMGDLHGDWDQTLRGLKIAGVVGRREGEDVRDRVSFLSTQSVEDFQWTGGSTILVQVGDILDRGSDEIALLSLLRHLDSQARQEGGAVFLLNGNHETMNVAEEFRYVTEGGFGECEGFVKYCTEECGGDYHLAFTHWWRVSQKRKPTLEAWGGWNPLITKRKVRLRSELFEVGGPLALELSRFGVALLVNDTLFAHGGILPHHVDYGLPRMNRELSRWMRGDLTEKGRLAGIPFIAAKGFNSVVWTRLYSQEHFPSAAEKMKVCAVLRATLEGVGARRLVVGHTPQMMGANAEFNGLVWRIDVGMSRGMIAAPPQVIEIVGDEVTILAEEGSLACY